MIDREKVISGLNSCFNGEVYPCDNCPYVTECKEAAGTGQSPLRRDVLALLKEPEKKQITLLKKHVITWTRKDELKMRNLYEAICKTLLDEGELIVERIDNHGKVDFVFYVADGTAKLK